MNHTSTRRSGQTFQRLVLPLALFLVIMAGLAWVMQNVPQVPPNNNVAVRQAETGPVEPLVVFDKTLTNPSNPSDVRAFWDPNDPTYIKEFEPNVPGHYDFSFEIASKDDLEMDLSQPSCDCLKVEVNFMDLADLAKWRAAKDRKEVTPESGWKEVPKEPDLIIAPAGKGGLLRLAWKSRRGEGQNPRLAFKVRFHPKGKIAVRQEYRVDTLLVMVPPVMINPAEAKLGAVTIKSQATFYLWSSTRDKIALTLNKKEQDPRFECTLEELDGKARTELQADLKKKDINTRVKIAYRLKATVYEEKGGKWLDQGYFLQSIPLELDGAPADKMPTVQGFVAGAVQVGGPDDQGKIALKSFAGADGVTRSYAIGTDPKEELTVGEVKPEFLEVKLKENKKESTPGRKIWTLEVKVPPSRLYGPLPENSAIILRPQNPQSRMIRIPVTGIGVQG